ncbi:hypothetical protein M1L60_38495 [Actinoplanes sp. TRM 88003]|uniref:Uncharacterized protein n=1 Tax=Paractinoplanes aksuensis TaxID=2939490 RepID=A0ABT1E055_9ACTN|nr:hypothetical protein [Actinoplanes aksuensis]MCO8276484.1 hypothetical protein [Actinoplanes aksuensis]
MKIPNVICNMSVPMALPALAATGGDDPAVRKRAADGIVDQVQELAARLWFDSMWNSVAREYRS